MKAKDREMASVRRKWLPVAFDGLILAAVGAAYLSMGPIRNQHRPLAVLMSAFVGIIGGVAFGQRGARAMDTGEKSLKRVIADAMLTIAVVAVCGVNLSEINKTVSSIGSLSLFALLCFIISNSATRLRDRLRADVQPVVAQRSDPVAPEPS